METFGQRLRRLRTEKGLSVPDVSSCVGVSPSAIHQLERENVKSPSFALGVRLARFFNVDPGYLALGEGSSFQDHFDALDRRVAKVERWMAQQPKRR